MRYEALRLLCFFDLQMCIRDRSRLSKDETVSMEALARLCEALQCQLEEIIEYKLENKDRVE